MRIKGTLVVLALVAMALPQVARAADNTYIATNHRFNFVQLKEVKAKEAERLKIAHPQQIDIQGLKGALASVNLSRSFIIKKEVDSQRVFNDAAVDYLSVNLARAFSEAKPNQIVEFGFLQKEPIFILRNDRLNLGKAWLSEDGLHITFDKLYAKLLGDTDARGHEGEEIARAKGLRIHLDVGPGQQLSLADSSELILDLHHNFAEDLQQKANEPPPVPKTMAGEEGEPPAAAPAAKAEGKKGAKKEKQAATTKGIAPEAAAKSAAEASAEATAAAAQSAALTPEQRMKAVDQMRKDGLISKKEYEQKKKEILGGL